MNALDSALRAIGRLFRWWVIVTPWEQAIRVRFGKHVSERSAGLHFSIPYLDRFYIQSTRLRVANVMMQTLESRDGKTVLVRAVVKYRIRSALKLYETLHQPQDLILDLTQGHIAEVVRRSSAEEVVSELLDYRIDFEPYGMEFMGLRIPEFARSGKPIRIIKDEMGYGTHEIIESIMEHGKPAE